MRLFLLLCQLPFSAWDITTTEQNVNEMVISIVLGIRLSPNSFQRVTVGNISLDSKVEHLKAEASRTTNLPRHFIGKCRETELNSLYLHSVNPSTS
jgi:hypothetical protein